MRRPLLLFGLLLLLFPAVSALFTGLRDGFATLAVWQWALVLLLPGLVWLWYRHFSRLGCRDGCAPLR